MLSRVQLVWLNVYCAVMFSVSDVFLINLISQCLRAIMKTFCARKRHKTCRGSRVPPCRTGWNYSTVSLFSQLECDTAKNTLCDTSTVQIIKQVQCVFWGRGVHPTYIRCITLFFHVFYAWCSVEFFKRPDPEKSRGRESPCPQLTHGEVETHTSNLNFKQP